LQLQLEFQLGLGPGCPPLTRREEEIKTNGKVYLKKKTTTPNFHILDFISQKQFFIIF